MHNRYCLHSCEGKQFILRINDWQTVHTISWQWTLLRISRKANEILHRVVGKYISMYDLKRLKIPMKLWIHKIQSFSHYIKICWIIFPTWHNTSKSFNPTPNLTLLLCHVFVTTLFVQQIMVHVLILDTLVFLNNSFNSLVTCFDRLFKDNIRL